ncbi:MAG: GGDEF domain-containing protein [Gammaproteobacteria bacterium]
MAYGRGKMLINGATSRSRTVSLQRVASTVTAERRIDGHRSDEYLIRNRSEEDGIGGGRLGELARLRSANERLLREVEALREREAQVKQLADRDELTGLYNRRRMREMLESAIEEAARQEQCVGLLFIDLNGFKGINDEYGHAAGDKILTTVATRIAARVRNSDIVCRYGGDEFVVVLPNVPDAGAVTNVADAIRERVSLPCWIQRNEQHLTAAIGQALCPHDGRTADDLLHRADLAMYQLKARLARPMLTLGGVPYQRPLRRRNDKSAPGA